MTISKENWEIAILEFETKEGKYWKVTRRSPKFKIAETKMFQSKQKPLDQFQEWL